MVKRRIVSCSMVTSGRVFWGSRPNVSGLLTPMQGIPIFLDKSEGTNAELRSVCSTCAGARDELPVYSPLRLTALHDFSILTAQL